MNSSCIGVIAAMPQEIAPLLQRVQGYKREKVAGINLYRFQVQGTRVVLVESGMGPARAAAATKTLISVAAPKAIVNMGFAGGVLPGLAIGDLVLAGGVLMLENGRLTQTPQPHDDLGSLLMASLSSAELVIRRGTFITAAAIMNKAEVARSLPAQVNYPVLEMETAAVLSTAQEGGVPAVAIRGISDAADEELGFSLEEFCDADLNIRLPRVLGCVAGKPWIIPQLLRLSANTKRAGKTLALGVELALKALSEAWKSPR